MTHDTTPRKWYERLAAYLESKERVDSNGKRRSCRRMIRRERDGKQEDYLERFYVLSTPWLGIYLHRFWAGDDDGLHDHPWNSLSILLNGSYLEEQPERRSVPYGPSVTYLRRPLHPICKLRTKHDAHRITIPEGEAGAWSLFIRFGLKRRQWGFYRNRGWKAAEVQSRKEERRAFSVDAVAEVKKKEYDGPPVGPPTRFA